MYITEKKNNLTYKIVADLFIIAVGVIIAIYLVGLNLDAHITKIPSGFEAIVIFLAGILFVSVFTTGPATVILGTLAQNHSLAMVALLGGLGALIGDFLIFKFIKDKVYKDLSMIHTTERSLRLKKFFEYKIAKFVLGFVGALIIASPLPDELGLALMGLSKIKTGFFIFISYTFNTLGIFVIGIIARTLI